MSGTTDALPPGQSDVLAHRLGIAVGALARRIRPSHGELSAGHFSALASLERLGPVSLGDLARLERVTAPTMTRLVNTLQERGYVARRRGTLDARTVAVQITRPGRAAVAQVRQERAETMQSLLQALSADQLQRLRGALDAIEQLATTALATPPDDGAGVLSQASAGSPATAG